MNALRSSIDNAVRAFADAPLQEAGLGLLDALGYRSAKSIALDGNPDTFAREIDNENKLALPTDGFVSPSDFDLLVLGRLYKQYGGVRNSKEIPIIGGPIGYLMR